MSKRRFETHAIRTQAERSQHKEHSTPLHLTSSFVFDGAEHMQSAFAGETEANIYSRFINPNSTEFIDKMCLLEQTEAGFATASGMAAIYATFASICQQGDHILSFRNIFGSTHGVLNKILPKFGITSTYIDVNDQEHWGNFVKPNTKLVYVETPTNPGLDIVDLSELKQFCETHGLLLVVDNCFATPYLQQPATLGADLVIHSATKYLDGQGRVMGGVVLGKAPLIEEVFAFCRSTGPSLSPFNAWVLSKSLETLAVRMDRHCSNALELAKRLESHSGVTNIKYPFLASHPQYDIARKQMSAGGGLVAFELKGGIEKGRSFLNGLNMCSLTANLGDTRTIASHPSSTTHAKLTEEERLQVGITPGMIRISTGLEHIEDIWGDIEQALS